MAVSDRIAVMNEGSVVQEGTARGPLPPARLASSSRSSSAASISCPARVVAVERRRGRRRRARARSLRAQRRRRGPCAAATRCRSCCARRRIEIVRERAAGPLAGDRRLAHVPGREDRIPRALRRRVLQVVRYNAGPGDVVAEGTRSRCASRRARARVLAGAAAMTAPVSRRPLRSSRSSSRRAACAADGTQRSARHRRRVRRARASRWPGASLRGAEGERHRRRAAHRRGPRDAIAWLAVVGIDPFTQTRGRLQSARRRSPARSTCASRARTSPTFRAPSSACGHASAAPARHAPALVVFYLGVPDTTPEFARTDELDRSLDERIARARDDSEGNRHEPRRARPPARPLGAQARGDRRPTSAPGADVVRAWRIGFYCVQPCWVTLAAAALAGIGARVVTVVGFPHGCDRAGGQGARRGDRGRRRRRARSTWCMNFGALKSGARDGGRRRHRGRRSRGARHPGQGDPRNRGAHRRRESASRAGSRVDAGAAFVKTSTGFHPAGGATVADVRLLRAAVGPALRRQGVGRHPHARRRAGHARCGRQPHRRIGQRRDPRVAIALNHTTIVIFRRSPPCQTAGSLCYCHSTMERRKSSPSGLPRSAQASALLRCRAPPAARGGRADRRPRRRPSP